MAVAATARAPVGTVQIDTHTVRMRFPQPDGLVLGTFRWNVERGPRLERVVFLCAPQALYAVNRHAAFAGYAATFELAETEVAPQHWSRR
jgi:hypothetical protein